MKGSKRARRLTHLAATGATVLLLTIAIAFPAQAARPGDLNSVIDSVRNWMAGLLIALVTLFLTVGGIRYLTANGNPRAVRRASRRSSRR